MDSSEVEIIIQSMALIIAMPIAGASTAWSQNGSGNIALSLGLAILSTVISPITTRIAMGFVRYLFLGSAA